MQKRMKFARRLEEVGYDRNSVVTVGSFDGVHLAHREILKDVIERARDRKGRSILVTFDPHPREIVRPEKPVLCLTSTEERRALCEDLGIDVMLVVPFTYEFSRLSSRDFILNYLVRGTGVSEMVEGYDHHFGRDREGSIEAVLALGREFTFTITAVQQVNVDDVPVSSSVIREQLLEGDVTRAARFLGRPYAVTGTVVEGDKRGRSLGYPTANISPEFAKKLIPHDGIYFVSVDLGDGKSRFGLASIGTRPTFRPTGARTVEVYILDFEGALYGKQLTMTFLQRLRDERRFDGADELIKQMDLDREQAKVLVRQFVV